MTTGPEGGIAAMEGHCGDGDNGDGSDSDSDGDRVMMMISFGLHQE